MSHPRTEDCHGPLALAVTKRVEDSRGPAGLAKTRGAEDCHGPAGLAATKGASPDCTEDCHGPLALAKTKKAEDSRGPAGLAETMRAIQAAPRRHCARSASWQVPSDGSCTGVGASWARLRSSRGNFPGPGFCAGFATRQSSFHQVFRGSVMTPDRAEAATVAGEAR
jgi:hypothetical protein